MPRTVNVNYVTKEVKILLHDSETESLAAATAIAAAESAQEAKDVVVDNLQDSLDAIDAKTETEKTEIATLGQEYVDSASQKVDEANTILTAIRNEYGYPFTATTAADMTDTTKIYVYTGSETGYTNGNWYYYDGSAWVSGGIYNAVAFTTDTTLTVSSAAADAKVTGEIFNVTTELKDVGYAVKNNYGIAIDTKTVVNVGSAYKTTSPIPVTPGEVYSVSGSGKGNYAVIAFADEDGIDSTLPASMASSNDVYAYSDKTIKIPTGITKMYIAQYSNASCPIAVHRIDNSAESGIQKLKNDVEDINTGFAELTNETVKYLAVGADDPNVVSEQHYYFNLDGSKEYSTDNYNYIAYKIPRDSYVYAVTDSTWHELCVFSDVPFNPITKINVYSSSVALPTEDNPLQVYAGNYVVIVQKGASVNHKIYYSVTAVSSIKEDTMLPITNMRLSTVENDAKKAIPVSHLYRKHIPDYYFARPETATSFDDDEYLQARIKSIPKGKHFIFVTDTHWDGTYDGQKNNERRSNDLINYVRGIIGSVPVVFGGDVVNANPTKYQAVRVIKSYFNECAEAFGDKFYPVLGNHDLNVIGQSGDPDVYCIPYSVVTPLFTGHLDGVAELRDETDAIATKTSDPDLAAEYDAYFKINYVVHTGNGITFIVYNTGAHGKFVNENFGIHGSDEICLHQRWLYNVLMNIPEGNDVVLIGHEATYGITEPLTSWNMRSAIFQMCGLAAKKKVQIYQQSNVIKEQTYPWIPSSNYVSYDFRNAPDAGKVFVLQGHWHHDFVVKVGITGDGSSVTGANVSIWNGTDHFLKDNGEIPIITTLCDAAGQYRNESNSGYTTDPSDFVMGHGDVTEQAFDVVTITDNGIVTTRIGAAEKPDYLQRNFTVENLTT